uniref:Immunoglobulin C1-set domain-containing protein n=1 Tax=Electrophorus electricus TaxID=8005 RepID=A0AAY5EYY6_ELEEL
MLFELSKHIIVFNAASKLYFVLLNAVKVHKHSVYYKYMIRSGNSIDNITDFTEVTVLDGKQIDSYSSRDSIRTPKQDWLKKLPERDQQTVKNSQENMCLCTERVSVSLNFRCSHSSVRFGCKTEATFNILNCSNEYGYDGEDLISYDWISKQWKASVEQVQHTADLWNNIYLNYSNTEISQTNVDVYIFAKRAVSDPGKLTLTCLATSFYPKDVMMSVRKYRTSLPEELITSSGVRTNDEDTYQLRKSVNILENDEEYYECYVAHSSLTEPVIINWDGKHSDSSKKNSLIGVVIRAVICGAVRMAVVATIVIVHKNKSMIGKIAQVSKMLRILLLCPVIHKTL